MRYLKDPWLQVFLFLTVASGVMAAIGVGPAGKTAKIEPKPPLDARQQPEPAHTLKAKAPGKWVVDAKLALDADTDKLGEALANASAGDTVYVRVGTYKETVAIKRDVSIVGLGAQREIVVDGDAAGPTVAVDGAKVKLKNLTLSHSGIRPGKALESRRATLELQTVAVKVQAQDSGVDVIGGGLTAFYLTVEGGHRGVDAHDEAKLSLDHPSISKAETALYLQGATAHLAEPTLTDNKKGVTVAEQGSALISGGELSRNGVAVWANRGGQAKLASVKLAADGTAVVAEERGRAETESCAFSEETAGALLADTGGQAMDKGSTILRAQGTAAAAKAQGTLALVDTQIEDGQGDAVAVLDGGSAALSGVKLARNARAGVVIKDARAVRLDRATIVHHKRCALELDGGEVAVKASTLQQNDCGAAFYGKATLDIEGSDFSGNDHGPLLYKPDQKDGIVLRGKNNNPRNLTSLIQ